MFPLKNYSASEIEKALSIALSELCGRKVSVKISALVDKTNTDENSEFWELEKAEIVMTASYDGRVNNPI